jgi:hypothetical protein
LEKKALKGLGILVVLALVATIVERWYAMFFIGQLYANVGIGLALLGFAVPIVTVLGGAYVMAKIYRA